MSAFWMDHHSAARALGVNVRQMSRFIETGQLRAFDFGVGESRRYFYLRSDVAAFKRKREREKRRAA